MKKVAVMTLITVFALTGVAIAKGPGRQGSADANGQKDVRGMFWERERVAETLSLTEEEKTKLTEMHNEHRSVVQEMREDLEEQRQVLRDTMASEDFSPSEAKEQFQKAEKAHSRIQEERFELQIEQRELLGPERFAKLQKMERRLMKNKRGKQKP